MKTISYKEFQQRYPNEDVVLNEVFDHYYGDLNSCPDCERETKWHRIQGRKCYSCQHCGHQLFPLANTPMKDTKLSLVDWYFAIFLFSNSKNGVSSKELQRQLGVSYKTALRMHDILCKSMADNDVVLDQDVEMDETLVGGRKRGGKRGWGSDNACVFGMVERGGNAVVKVVPNRKRKTLFPIIATHTTEEVTAHTDDFGVYKTVAKELVAAHTVVSHTKGEHVAGPDGNWHTQTIDGFWSILKRSIRGTYVSVSKEKLQLYVDEFTFRRNHRHECIFDVIRERIG